MTEFRGIDAIDAAAEYIAAGVAVGFVARMPPDLPEHAQRLLATLGVPVVFERVELSVAVKRAPRVCDGRRRAF